MSIEILRWGQRFSVGNEKVDLQHKMLVNIINYLVNNSGDAYTQREMEDLLEELVDYTGYHFIYEEKLLAHHPEIERHKEEHRDFLDKMRVFERKFYLRQENINRELFAFLVKWLREHLLETDLVFFKTLKTN